MSELNQVRLIEINRLYNQEEACQVLNCCRGFVVKQRTNGKLKVIKMGRKVMFLGEHLLEYIHSNAITETKTNG